MYNPGDDKELDQLSREAADKYEAPGQSSWESLARELDKLLPVTEKKRRRFLFYWWLIPCLLLGGTAYWWLQNNNQPTTTSDQSSVAAKKPAAIGGGQPTIKKQPATSNNTPAKNQQTDLKEIIYNQPDKHVPAQNTMGNAKEAAANSSLANVNSTGDKNNISVAQKDSLNTFITSINETKSQLDSNNQAGIVPKKSILLPQKKVSFGLLTGVDLSTVKFRYANDIGYNFGLLAGYHFNNRWSVHTGAIYTRKNYKLAGTDFTAPKGTPISYYQLETVEGYCYMWEVPLLVRYHFPGQATRHFFISTGLSSYFMKEENYDYYYHYNGQPVTRNNNYNTGDTHIFSIAHLSAGVEQRIGQNLSVDIEPYAKIPLTGVGFGSIRLSSFGLNLSVQFRQSYHK